MNETLQALAALGAILLGFMALAKYVLYLIGRHEKEYTKALTEMSNSLKENRAATDYVREQVQATREEMHRDFVRHHSLEQALSEMRDVQSAMFERINSIDKHLNRLVGAFRRRGDDD